MQGQAASLEQMGIPAAALNSQIAWPEQQNIMRRAVESEYRLLYLSPERLLREDFIEFLARVPLSFFRDRRSALHFGVGARVSS
jgi:ATP-dependent DNA helicase RecQ